MCWFKPQSGRKHSTWLINVSRKARRSVITCTGQEKLKVQWQETFCLRILSWIIFPQAPKNRVISIFFKNSRRTSKRPEWYTQELGRNSFMKKPEVENLVALSLKIHVRKVKRIDTTWIQYGNAAAYDAWFSWSRSVWIHLLNTSSWNFHDSHLLRLRSIKQSSEVNVTHGAFPATCARPASRMHFHEAHSKKFP